MTIHHLTAEFSAKSACWTISLYRAEKSSALVIIVINAKVIKIKKTSMMGINSLLTIEI
jgi:hypothetical protein